jgi:uncharacterized protein (TIGR02453 family)
MMEFFLSIRFNNNQAFFEENRARYQSVVQQPLRELAQALGPAMLKIDPQLDVRPARVVSRIRRDTRFSRNKDPYRDHMWLAWRHTGEATADALSYYWEVSPEAMHWGFGYYAESRAAMDVVRRGMLAKPRELLDLYAHCGVPDQFALLGNEYKRLAVPEELPQALRPMYIKKGFYFQNVGGAQDFDLLHSGQIERRLGEDFEKLAPLYNWLRGRRQDEPV